MKSSGEKVRLKDKDISVWSEKSVNGRLFVLPKKHSEQVVVCIIRSTLNSGRRFQLGDEDYIHANRRVVVFVVGWDNGSGDLRIFFIA